MSIDTSSSSRAQASSPLQRQIAFAPTMPRTQPRPTRTFVGIPAVVAAAYCGHTAVLGVLLGAPGLAVDSPDPCDGETALMAASRAGETECVGLLLGGGAQPGLQDEDGETALDKAEAEGHTEIAAMLRAAAAAAHQPQAPASPAAPAPAPTPLATLTAMGFPEDDCRRALAAACDDLDHAIQYLTEGIPDAPPPQAPAPAPAPAQPPTPAAPEPAAPLSEGDPYEAELASLKISVLKKRARSLGATAEQMDAVDDADDSRAAAVALMLSLRSALEAAKVSELKKRLRTLGATDDQMDEVDDAPDPKSTAVQLLLQLAATTAGAGAGAAAASPGPAAAAPAQLGLLPKYVAADKQIRVGKPADATHGIQVLMGLTDHAMSQFYADPVGAIRKEFAAHGSADDKETCGACWAASNGRVGHPASPSNIWSRTRTLCWPSFRSSMWCLSGSTQPPRTAA